MAQDFDLLIRSRTPAGLEKVSNGSETGKLHRFHRTKPKVLASCGSFLVGLSGLVGSAWFF